MLDQVSLLNVHAAVTKHCLCSGVCDVGFFKVLWVELGEKYLDLPKSLLQFFMLCVGQ